MSTVLVSDRQLVELPRDVICGSGICIPICVDAVGVSDSMCLLLLVLIFFIAIPAFTSAATMMLGADLALGIIPVRWALLLLLKTTTSHPPVAATWGRGRPPPTAAALGAACAPPGPVLTAATVHQVS